MRLKPNTLRRKVMFLPFNFNTNKGGTLCRKAHFSIFMLFFFVRLFFKIFCLDGSREILRGRSYFLQSGSWDMRRPNISSAQWMKNSALASPWSSECDHMTLHHRGFLGRAVCGPGPVPATAPALIWLYTQLKNMWRFYLFHKEFCWGFIWKLWIMQHTLEQKW